MSDTPLLDALDDMHARKTDPKTSHVAIGKIRVGTIKYKILWALNRHEASKSGLTTVEIGQMIRVPRDVVSPNMKPLERAGYLYRSGYTRRTRLADGSSTGQLEVWWISRDKVVQVHQMLAGFDPSPTSKCCPTCNRPF